MKLPWQLWAALGAAGLSVANATFSATHPAGLPLWPSVLVAVMCVAGAFVLGNRLGHDAEMRATTLTVVLGASLAVLVTFSFADGIARANETPFRVMLGDARYSAMMEGEQGTPHYLGRSRLAPDFTLEQRDGSPWNLEDHRGKVIVMNFWSITCPPCLEEMPSLEILGELSERWDDVEIVAVATDPSWEDVATVIPDNSHMTQLIDPEKAVSREMFGTELYPETWIIDADGVIRLRFDGAFDWSDPVVLDVIEAYR